MKSDADPDLMKETGDTLSVRNKCPTSAISFLKPSHNSQPFLLCSFFSYPIFTQSQITLTFGIHRVFVLGHAGLDMCHENRPRNFKLETELVLT